MGWSELSSMRSTKPALTATTCPTVSTAVLPMTILALVLELVDGVILTLDMETHMVMEGRDMTAAVVEQDEEEQVPEDLAVSGLERQPED